MVSDSSWSYGDDPVFFDWETGTTKIRQGYGSDDRLCYLAWAKVLEDEWDKGLSDVRKKRVFCRARVKQMRELRKRGTAKIFTDVLNLFPKWANEDRKKLWGLWIESGA